MIQERLKALRAEMEKRGITVYVVPTADFHESEYVGDHFKARKFITGFTGSAGTAVTAFSTSFRLTENPFRYTSMGIRFVHIIPIGVPVCK